MQIVNPNSSYPIGSRVENINGVAMRGAPEKQGWSFSRAGYLAALADPLLDADAVGRAVHHALRPLSAPTLEKAREEYAHRTVIPFPRYFIIEPTALCNRRCPFCTIIVTNRKGMMKWDHFAQLMVECGKHGVYGLSLYQLGEPFLWHDKITAIGYIPAYAIYDEVEKRIGIEGMVDYAKEVGGFCAVNLSTNGDVPNLADVLDSRLDDLIISIDGTTAEVYDANRPSTKANDADAFERTIGRVRDFLERKAARGDVKPFVRLQCINKENTAGQVLDFIRYWIDIPGVDDVLIKNLDSMRPWLGSKIVSDAEDALKAEHLGAMPCQHLYAVGSMVVDGRFNACAHDARTELTTAGANIDAMTFSEWWNGEYLMALRAQHNAGAFRKPCLECREKDTWLG